MNSHCFDCEHYVCDRRRQCESLHLIPTQETVESLTDEEGWNFETDLDLDVQTVSV